MIYALPILGLWTSRFSSRESKLGCFRSTRSGCAVTLSTGKPSALRLERLMQRPERLLITVLLVTNMADILGLLLLTKLLVASFGYAGFFISILLALPIYLLVLAVLPKSLFRRFPFRALAALAGVLEFVSLVLWPVLEIGERLGRILIPRRASEGGRLFVAREELKQIAVQSRARGLSHFDRARHDPQRGRFSKRYGVPRDGADRPSNVRAARHSHR